MTYPRSLFILALMVCGDRASAEFFDRMCDSRPPCVAAAIRGLPSASLVGLAENAELSVREYQLHAGLLEFGVGNSVLETGVDYQYTRYEYSGVDSRNRDLHRLQLPIRFESGFDAWALQGYVAPGISTSSNVFKDYMNHGNSADAFVAGRINGQ